MAKGKQALFLGGLTLGAIAGLSAYGRWLIARSETLEPEEVREPEETVYIGGRGIHYIDQGQGTPLVLVHGLGGSSANFSAIIPFLVRDFRVIAPDLLGFGLSDRPADADYSLGAQAKLLRDFMERLSIVKASLLGHSLGGPVALYFASLFPERVDKLILACSPPPTRLSSPLLAWPPFRPLLEAVVGFTLHSSRFREGLLRQGFYDPASFNAETAERYLFPSRLHGSARVVAKMIGDIGLDQAIDVSKIGQPVLLLWAEGERWLPPFIGEKMAAMFSDGHFQLIPRAGHLLLEERPHEGAEAIRMFLLGKIELPTGRLTEAQS